MWGSNQGYWMELEEIILIVNLSKKLTFQANSPEIRAKFRNIFALEKGKRTHKKTRLVWSYCANVCVPVHCCHHFLPLVTWTPSSQCKLNLAQQQQLNRKVPTSFMKTNNKLKEGDPISTHSEGNPLAWALLVGTDSSTLARAVADASITLTVCSAPERQNPEQWFLWVLPLWGWKLTYRKRKSVFPTVPPPNV